MREHRLLITDWHRLVRNWHLPFTFRVHKPAPVPASVWPAPSPCPSRTQTTHASFSLPPYFASCAPSWAQLYPLCPCTAALLLAEEFYRNWSKCRSLRGTGRKGIHSGERLQSLHHPSDPSPCELARPDAPCRRPKQLWPVSRSYLGGTGTQDFHGPTEIGTPIKRPCSSSEGNSRVLTRSCQRLAWSCPSSLSQ